jgi:copper chaperone CopZ
VVAALYSVTGVRSAAVNRAKTEVIVLRDARYLRDQDLLDAVLPTGYGATLVPLETVRLTVDNLDCTGCAGKAESVLRGARGARYVALDAPAHRAVVTIDRRKTDRDRLISALKGAGFPAREA